VWGERLKLMQFNQLVFDQIISEGEYCFIQKLTDNQIAQVQVFINEFIRWNAVHNLSAVSNFETLMRAHFLDSMSIVSSVAKYLKELKHPFPINVADLGSGGGFPSIVLAILLPEINFYAIESIKKKTAFLQSIKLRLKLDNYFVVDQRIEHFAKENPNFFDATISRAFTELNNYLEYSKSLIKDESFVFAMKSQRVDEELKKVTGEWVLVENIEIEIPKLDAYRCLLVMSSMRKY
jgi:16S rRNA (guanine527-N7)-methyltransferase